MPTCDSSIRIRIDSKTKSKASEALEQMGLTLSDALRMTLVQIAATKRLPFAVEIPNAVTREAMEELESGGGEEFDSIEDICKDLGI